MPDTIVRLASFFPTPGYCDEEMNFFGLSGLSVPEQAATPDEDEDIEVRTFTVADRTTGSTQLWIVPAGANPPRP